ncbi:MAG: type II toxin-antitoxin system mRNA interferase toxin, RelE/StbE family, partial [Patescibacteria group bacterium]
MKRPIKKVVFSSYFQKEFDRLPRQIQKLADRKNERFCENAFDPSLETHTLSGKFEGDWAYSINRSYRV